MAVRQSPFSKFILLGESGYTGTALSRHLKDHYPGASVTGFSSKNLDLLNPSQISPLKNHLTPQTCLIMLAGITLDRMKDSPEIFESNLAMARNLAAFLRENPPGHFVYFSSVSVYGDRETNLHINEETPASPSTHYGRAKLEAEALFQKAGESAGFPVLILRPCRIYGPGVLYANYGPVQFIQSILKDEPVLLYGKGEELRDQLYIADLVRMTCALLDKRAAGIYNCASGSSISFRHLADCLLKIAGKKFEVTERPRSRPLIDQGFKMQKFLKTAGPFQWTPVEEGLRQTFASFSNSHPLYYSKFSKSS